MKAIEKIFFILSILYSQTFLAEVQNLKSEYFSKDDNTSTVERHLRDISFSVKCMFVDDFNLYDISGLGINKYKSNENAYHSIINDTTIFYNFCYDLKDIKNCSKYSKVQMLALDSNNSCDAIADSIHEGNKWSTWRNEKENYDFLRIDLNPIKEDHKVAYKLKCNKTTKMKFNETESYFKKRSGDNFETLITIETEEACPKFDFYVIWKFVNDYYYIFASLLIVLGIFNCILGLKFAKYTSFLLTLFGVTVFILFFAQFILPSGCRRWIIWVILAFGIIIGSTAGYYVFLYHEYVMAFVVGALAGFLLGEFLFNLFGNAFSGSLTLIHILFIVICIIGLIVVAFFFKPYIVIFATSFIGAYIFIRGISLFAGHFPSEFTIIDLKNQGETEQIKDLFTWRVYVYLSFTVIICGLSIFVQIKINNGLKNKEEEEAPDDNLLNCSKEE